ncbi:hypothetical protein Zmor_017724 [Zophobas morio]|uniref:Uncharacterized protein n=1 Tax=Zophobas morio TaxID=2755281 RepID=A0AA38ICV8_9CUCU|nr:hypothetical protein Zmor_017724 [Zophobas morio]
MGNSQCARQRGSREDLLVSTCATYGLGGQILEPWNRLPRAERREGTEFQVVQHGIFNKNIRITLKQNSWRTILRNTQSRRNTKYCPEAKFGVTWTLMRGSWTMEGKYR